MTPKELEILKAISCTDVETFFPAGGSAAEAQAFDELVDWLQGLRRLGWIELEVAEQAAHVGSIGGNTSPRSRAVRITDDRWCRCWESESQVAVFSLQRQDDYNG